MRAYDDRLLGELQASSQALRSDLDGVKVTLDEVRQIAPLIHKMADGLEVSRKVSTDLSQTIARLGATLDGLVQDIGEVRLEQSKLRDRQETLATEQHLAQVHNAGMLQRALPIIVAIIATITAVWTALSGGG